MGARHREILNASSPIGTSTDAAGGVAVVSDDVAADLFYRIMHYQAPVLRLFSVSRRTRGGKAHAPGLDDADDRYGTLLDENGTVPTGNPGFVKSAFAFNKIHSKFIKVSYEALADMEIEDLAEEIIDTATARASRMLGHVATRGKAGTALTVGVLANGTYPTPKEWNGAVTAAGVGKTTAGAAITADEFIEFIGSLKSQYEVGGRERLMLAKSTLTALRLLKDGDSRYLLPHMDSTAVDDGVGDIPPRGWINGVPYIFNDEVAAVAAGARVAVYGDLKSYRVILQRSLTTERFHDSNTAASQQVWFTAWMRATGVLRDANALRALVMHA